MSRFDKDNAIFKIETAVEKADYLAKSLIQNYKNQKYFYERGIVI